MNDLIGKSKDGKQIWTKKKYVVFIGIISRPETKRIVYLRLANLEKDNEDEEEDNEDEKKDNEYEEEEKPFLV